MVRPLASRIIAASIVAFAAFGAAPAAQAHTDIQVSIGLPGLPVFVQPPVYVRTEPVYVQPRPVYVAPPEVVYERRGWPSYRSDFERERGWRRAQWQRHEWDRQEGARGHRGWSRSGDRDED